MRTLAPSTLDAHVLAPEGLSSQSIASGIGRDYPHDPSDLWRCVRYCNGRFDSAELRARMARLSPQWDALTAIWDELVALLREEMGRQDGMAPQTYARMKCAINNGVLCAICDGTSRGEECPKCHGTGRRGGGRCRAKNCWRGADFCPTCHGRGHTPQPT